MSLELDTSKWFHIFYLVNEISKTKNPIGPLKIFFRNDTDITSKTIWISFFAD